MLVVGAGPGGCAAAVEAARAGAAVVVLEASPAIGGNAARSTGYLAFLDFPMQHEAGIADSEERFVGDILREVASQQERYGIVFDAWRAEQFVREVRDLWGFLADLGFAFNRFIPRPTQHTADRMVDVSDTTMFTTCFERAFADLGVEVRTGTRATRLLESEGRVVGAAAGDVGGARAARRGARGRRLPGQPGGAAALPAGAPGDHALPRPGDLPRRRPRAGPVGRRRPGEHDDDPAVDHGRVGVRRGEHRGQRRAACASTTRPARTTRASTRCSSSPGGAPGTCPTPTSRGARAG